MLENVIDMARPKKKADVKTVENAGPADRVKVQFVMPYELVLKLREEAFKRAAKDPAGAPSVSDVVCDLVREGLGKKK
jgi:hypothetical protein